MRCERERERKIIDRVQYTAASIHILSQRIVAHRVRGQGEVKNRNTIHNNNNTHVHSFLFCIFLCWPAKPEKKQTKGNRNDSKSSFIRVNKVYITFKNQQYWLQCNDDDDVLYCLLCCGFFVLYINYLIIAIVIIIGRPEETNVMHKTTWTSFHVALRLCGFLCVRRLSKKKTSPQLQQFIHSIYSQNEKNIKIKISWFVNDDDEITMQILSIAFCILRTNINAVGCLNSANAMGRMNESQ